MPKVTQKISKKQYRSPEAIIRRNEQERERVNAMNSAFDDLRKVVPFGEWKGKKKSKIQTIESAMQHIQHLINILESSKSVSNAYDLAPGYRNFPVSPQANCSLIQSANYHNSDLNSEGFSSENSDFTDCALPVMENLLTNESAAQNWNNIPVDYGLSEALQTNFHPNFAQGAQHAAHQQNYYFPTYNY